MPTYEYKCAACNYEFERFQSIMAEPIKRCPECGKAKVKRLIGTGSGVIFKGSGFYTTDYRSEAYDKSAKAENGNGTTGDKAESKPADKGGEKASADKPAVAEPAAKKEASPKSETPPSASKSAAKPSSKPSKGTGGKKS
jgi:putative FmdB family regulatory protein